MKCPQTTVLRWSWHFAPCPNEPAEMSVPPVSAQRSTSSLHSDRNPASSQGRNTWFRSKSAVWGYVPVVPNVSNKCEHHYSWWLYGDLCQGRGGGGCPPLLSFVFYLNIFENLGSQFLSTCQLPSVGIWGFACHNPSQETEEVGAMAALAVDVRSSASQWLL